MRIYSDDTSAKNRLTEVKSRRQAIQGTDTVADEDELNKRRSWQEIEGILDHLRLAGDLKVAAFFKGSKPKERGNLEKEYQTLLLEGSDQDLEAIAASFHRAEKAITPFNWEIEFPEVFDRENPGFDAIVGNPPFLGGKKISTNYSSEYVSWLSEQYVESKGSPDIVAYFFRRAFNLLRKNGAFGLIATNTIAQGGTRSAGLRFICNHGGIIYNATRRYRWPGVAAVVVSVIHIYKNKN